MILALTFLQQHSSSSRIEYNVYYQLSIEACSALCTPSLYIQKRLRIYKTFIRYEALQGME